jgi:hypothetical protein
MCILRSQFVNERIIVFGFAIGGEEIDSLAQMLVVRLRVYMMPSVKLRGLYTNREAVISASHLSVLGGCFARREEK